MALGDLEGRTIAGKYAVLSVIGQGAMGVVYRARQVALDKIVALKVLSGELRNDPSFVLRFHTEARAASRLEHPNSTRVLDFGEEPDGLLYIAMELLEGRTLAQVIETEFPLPPQRIASIMTQTLSAVGAAHALKVLHRDLKPENIVVLEGRDDEDRTIDIVKVCDFGIAKLESEQADGRPSMAPGPAPSTPKATMAGVIVGTPQYMSPEQALAQPLDVRSDLYSLGVVLYEMLTKRAPFDEGTPADVLRHHVSSEPRRPASLHSQVDPTLEAICLKALRKKPAERYASAREMRLALRELAALPPESQSLPTPAPRSRAFDASAPTISAEPVAVVTSQRPRRRSVWLAPLLLLAVAGVLVTWRVGSRTPHRTPVAATFTFAPADHDTMVPSTPQMVAHLAPTTEPVVTSPERSTARSMHARVTAPTASATDEATPIVTVAVSTPLIATAPPTTPPVVASQTAPTPPPVVRLDPARARVDIGAVRADRVDAASVTTALRHVDLVGCYRDAVAAGSDIDGDATLSLDMDDERITHADLVGGRFSPALRQCIARRTVGTRVPNVDTGEATAKVAIRFSAR